MDIEKELHILTTQELSILPEKQLKEIDLIFMQKRNRLLKQINANLNSMVQYYRIYHARIVKAQEQTGIRRYIPDILFADPEMIADVINDFDKIIYTFPKSMCGARYFVQKRVHRPKFSTQREPLQPKVFQVDYIDFNREQLISTCWISVKMNIKNKQQDALTQFKKQATKFVQFYIKNMEQNSSKVDPFDLDLIQNSFLACMQRVKEDLSRKLRECLGTLRIFKTHMEFMNVIKNRFKTADVPNNMLLLKFSMFLDGVYQWTRFYSYHLRRPHEKLQEPLHFTKEGILSSTISKVIQLNNQKQASKQKKQVPMINESSQSQQQSLNKSLSGLSIQGSQQGQWNSEQKMPMQMQMAMTTNRRPYQQYPQSGDQHQHQDQHERQMYIQRKNFTKKKFKTNNWEDQNQRQNQNQKVYAQKSPMQYDY